MIAAALILLGLGLCFEAFAHALLRRRVARLEAALLAMGEHHYTALCELRAELLDKIEGKNP